jgi:hypothetical protein
VGERGITGTPAASEAWIRRDIALVADGQQLREPIGNVQQAMVIPAGWPSVPAAGRSTTGTLTTGLRGARDPRFCAVRAP